MVDVIKSWKPLASGILSIITGMIGMVGGGIVVLMGDFVTESEGLLGFEPLGVPSIILGAVAIVGGIFALRRKHWLMAVIGAIFAIPCMPITGTLAIIFVALASEEFTPRSAAENKETPSQDTG